MNRWWVLLGILGAAWVIPMIGIREAGFPWWFFLCVGCFWFVVFLAAEPMYD